MTTCKATGCQNKHSQFGLCSGCYGKHKRGELFPLDGPLIPSDKVMVVECPENFYPRGALFLRREFFNARFSNWTTTIAKGYWPEGMVIETGEGERYRVVGEMLSPQTLEEVERE